MLSQRDSQRTRRALLEAAFAEIHRKGFQAAGIGDICAEAVVTKGALYHHFPNKRALGYAVIEEYVREMVSRHWLVPLAECDNPIDCLEQMIERAIGDMPPEDVRLGCPLNNLALEMSPVDEGFRQRIAEVYDLWSRGIAEALGDGRGRGQVGKHVKPEAAARFIVGALAGSRSMAKNAQSIETLRDCGECLVQYLETLRARPVAE